MIPWFLGVLIIWVIYRYFKSENKKIENNVVEDYKELLIKSRNSYDALFVDFAQLQQDYSKLLSQKKSSEVKVGQTVEQLVGFLDSFPYPDEEIKALYQPVDLIVFRENEIVFVEVKSGDSQLSPKQRKIKELVQDKKVRFETHRVNGKGYEIK